MLKSMGYIYFYLLSKCFYFLGCFLIFVRYVLYLIWLTKCMFKLVQSKHLILLLGMNAHLRRKVEVT